MKMQNKEEDNASESFVLPSDDDRISGHQVDSYWDEYKQSPAKRRVKGVPSLDLSLPDLNQFLRKEGKYNDSNDFISPV
jgi:hypothetical protein